MKTIFRLQGRPRRWVSVNDVMFHVPLRANTCYFCFSFQDGAVSLPVSRGDRRLYWASLANEAAGVWSTREGWCLYYSRSVFISKSCCALKVPAETLVMYLNFFLSTIESQRHSRHKILNIVNLFLMYWRLLSRWNTLSNMFSCWTSRWIQNKA